jgi:hypothetical protein
MGIKDIPGIVGRAFFKKESVKPNKIDEKQESPSQTEVASAPVASDSVEITDAQIAIEKENILASQNSIEDFDHAKSVLTSILNGVDEKNLLEIHGDADKVKTFLVM